MQTPAALRVRNTLSFLFVTFLMLDAALIFLSKDLWAIGRILLIAGVMYYILQGYRWAKWLLVVLLSLMVVALVALVIALSAKLSTLISVGSVVMAIYCGVIIGYLVLNDGVKGYFAWQRAQRSS